MKRALAALLLASAPALLPAAEAYSPNRLPPPLAEAPSLGVALSGGGPRGRAHLGVLQALHELRVPVGLIAGTSAGSLVGGLYAQSLDAERVRAELDQLDFTRLVADEKLARHRLVFRERERQINYLGGLQLGFGNGGLRAPKGLSSGRRLRWALRRLTAPSAGVEDFSALPVPFRAAATDLSLGEGAVLHSGDLAEAIMASAAVPGVFAPQPVSGRVMVDGLIFSNLPIDAAREAGVVVAVDITSAYPSGQAFHNVGAVLGGMVDTMITQNTQRQLALLGPRDLRLVPKVDFIGNLDYHRQGEAEAAGRQALLERKEQLAALQLSEADYGAWLARRRALARTQVPRLSGLRVDGGEAGLLEGLGQRPGQAPDFKALEEGLEDLLGTGLFEDLDYRLQAMGPGEAELLLLPKAQPAGQHVLDLGLKLVSDFEGRSEYELLLQITQRESALGRQWRHQVFVGRVNGLGSELTQPLLGPLFLAPQAQLQTRLAQLPGLGELQVQRGSAGVDLGTFVGRGAELRLGWHAARLWSPQWGGYGSGIESAAWQALLTVDTLDHPHFPSRGTYLRAQALEARGSLRGPAAHDLARLGLHQALSLGRLTLLLGGELQSSFGQALPVYEQAQLGGFLRLGGYRAGRFSGDELWLARALLAWRQPRPGNLLAKTLFYGVSLEAGEAGLRPWETGGTESYSAAAYVGLETLLGPLYFAHARNFEGAGVSYVHLGNPF